jgi:hypothetical protein
MKMEMEFFPQSGERRDWPTDWDDAAQVRDFNRRGALMGLTSPIFLDQLKFAAASGLLGDLLCHCDVPTKELRFGRRAILVLGRPVGDPLHVGTPWPPVFRNPSNGERP